MDKRTEKKCSRCHEAKDRSEFYTRVDGSLRGPCKSCWLSDLRSPVKRAMNARSKRLSNLKANYGMTELEYAQLLIEQAGRCAICGLREGTANHRGTVFSLSIDHDHQTGMVRGLLCNRCNRAIGLLGDDVALLRRAIEYLVKDEASAALLEAARLIGKEGQ